MYLASSRWLPLCLTTATPNYGMPLTIHYFGNKVHVAGQGVTVAMHGYQHCMHPTKSKLVLPFYERSEFAGLSYESQAEKIRKSWHLFAEKE